MADLENTIAAGLYDRGLVEALLRAGLVPDECRAYLAAIRRAAVRLGEEKVVEEIDAVLAGGG